MSADLLKRAAEKLRAAVDADHVFVAPWSAVPDDGSGSIAWSVRDPEGEVAGMVLGPEAEYIALMHPPVALALAEWLVRAATNLEEAEALAKRVESVGTSLRPEGWPESQFAEPIAVARAILREVDGD